jgi:hypothetical protein
MSNKITYKVGDKVKLKQEVLDGIRGNFSKLENQTKEYEIAAIDDDLICICFGPLVDGYEGSDETRSFANELDSYDHEVPEHLKGKKNRFWNIEAENIEEKIASKSMMDDLKVVGKKMAEAAAHGAKVGAATSGADFAYDIVCGWLHNQFGVSKEKLEDPVNREVITAASVALLYLGSSMLEEQVPGMERIQQGCELVIEGKAKDHTMVLMQTAVPMLMHISSLMDPEKAIENMTSNFDVSSFLPKQEEEQELVELTLDKTAAG